MEERGYIQERPSSFVTGAVYRWLVLIVISMICFGSYFVYDEVENFEKEMERDLSIKPVQYNLLYSLYSLPNTILVFFGGIVGDKIGLRLAGLLFMTLVAIGSVITALGISLSSHMSHTGAYAMVLGGRIIFGCGAESLNVIQTSMTSRWFAGSSSLALAMGIVLSVSRLGDFLTLAITPHMAVWFHTYKWVFWVGCILIGFSFAALILYCIMDKATEKYFPERQVNPDENALNFKAVLKFDVRFWLIAVVCMCYYGGIFPFVANVTNFLLSIYWPEQTQHDKNVAGYYASIVTLASMILSPFLGKFLDVVAYRPVFVILGSLTVIPAHLCLAFFLPHPIIPIIFIGLSFSLVPAALWPSIPIIIHEKETATAFGVMASIQNTGLFLINLLVGVIFEKAGYRWGMLFFVLMDAIGLVFAILLFIVDRSKGGQLCQTADERAAILANGESKPLLSEAGGAGSNGTINY